MVMYSFAHSFMTLAFSITCFLFPGTTRFDPMITLLGITFIIIVNLAAFSDCYSILKMKAGRDSEMNKIKLKILKISLIDEVIDLKTVIMADGQKALISHLKLNKKTKMEMKKESPLGHSHIQNKVNSIAMEHGIQYATLVLY